MANTIPITSKPVKKNIDPEAYVLGTQKNDDDVQALYRFPISSVRATGATDIFIVPTLISQHGVQSALSIFIEANIEYDSLTHICERFFAAAAKSDDKVYASEFYLSPPAPGGTKILDNASMYCEPSTISTAGRDDYAALPLFMPFDVDYTIDGETLEPVIHAIKNVYGDFSAAPGDKLVGVMQMTGWVSRTSDSTKCRVSYSAKGGSGFKPLPEAVRASDNSVRPFVIHAKYALGRSSKGFSSVSGVLPLTGNPQARVDTSHDGINNWRTVWGSQYCGSSICDVAFLQLMLEIKYADLGSRRVMRGCSNYDIHVKAAVAESGVKRVLITTSDAASLVVGSSVSLGTDTDRTKANCYSVCGVKKISSIEDITVGGTAYKAVYIDTDSSFNTTTSVYVNTHPWHTGATDSVQGNDGSPTDNLSGKEPFKIQGVEVMLGMWEALADVTMYESVDEYTVYVNRKASQITAGSSGTNPAVIGTVPKKSSAGWYDILAVNWDANDQEAYMLPQQTATSASGYGYCAAAYMRDASGAGELREWTVFGYLVNGNRGLACITFGNLLNGTNWYVGSRACGTAGNRGVYTGGEE